MVCSFGPVRTLPVVYVSAVIDGGSHPFPFRTRKLSLLSPMVLGLRARESRSLQDSRGPLSKDRGPLRFYRPLALRPGKDAPAGARSRDHARSVPSTCRSRPLAVNLAGGFFLCPDPSPAVMLTNVSISFLCQRHPEDVTLNLFQCRFRVSFSRLCRGWPRDHYFIYKNIRFSTRNSVCFYLSLD